MLTIKSDDVVGRAKAYESIVKAEEIHKPNTPESFNVLVNELKALCVDVDLMEEHDGKIEHVELPAEESVEEIIPDNDKMMELENAVLVAESEDTIEEKLHGEKENRGNAEAEMADALNEE
jgi:hypothetical protein